MGRLLVEPRPKTGILASKEGIGRVTGVVVLVLFALLAPCAVWSAEETPSAGLPGVPEEPPAYTLERMAEQRRMMLATYRGPYITILQIESGDPAQIAKAEAFINDRLDQFDVIGDQAMMGYFDLDLAYILYLFPDRLSSPTRDRIAQHIARGTKKGGKFYYIIFDHAADAKGLHSVVVNGIGGAAIGRNDLVAKAADGLEEFLHVYGEVGLTSTYNSPTYTQLQISALEGLSMLPSDLRTRVTARIGAERVWQQVALRFHAPSSSFGAPLSRAHLQDKHGALSNMRYTVHPQIPGGVLFDGTTFPERRGNLSTLSESLVMKYFLRPHVREIFVGKTFPYEVRARKYGKFAIDWNGARRTSDVGGYFDTWTYMTKRYVVGSAERGYAGTWRSPEASIVFQIHWSIAPENTQVGDVRTLFARGRMNDEVAELKHTHAFADNGYARAVQHGNSVILLYSPAPRNKEVMQTFSLTAIIPRHGKIQKIEAIADGRSQVFKGKPLTFLAPPRVFIQDGDVYLGLLPLEVTDRGRQIAGRIEQTDDHILLSWYNLQKGDASTWDEKTFLETRNGLLVEVGDVEEWKSFQGFFQAVAPSTISDTLAGDVRKVTYRRGDDRRSMEVDYDINRMAFTQKVFDGQLYAGPTLASPHTVAGKDAVLSVGGAMLRSRESGEPKFLTYAPDDGWTTVLYPFRFPVPLDLTTPKGYLRSEGFRMGRIRYQPEASDGGTRVFIDCERAPAPLRMKKPSGRYAVVVNDEDVTGSLTETATELIIPLPGNEVSRSDTSLEITLAPDWKKLATTGEGKVKAKITNTGSHPARDVLVSAYVLGFARQRLNRNVHRFDRIAPGQTKNISWIVGGIRRAGIPGVRAVASAENAPTATVEVAPLWEARRVAGDEPEPLESAPAGR